MTSFKGIKMGSHWKHKALVVGRIGIIRSLGREGVPVAVAQESQFSFERVSRYCQEYIPLPDLECYPEQAVELLEQYGERQEYRPVVFLNGESDVLLISRYRERLSNYYRIILANDGLINSLGDKGKFRQLSEEYDLPVPKTVIVNSKEEALEAGERIGYPCVLKPIRQRLWHSSDIIRAIGLHKAMLIKNLDELIRLLEILPPVSGKEMIQQYIPGNDQQHFDFHVYIDTTGRPRGGIVGHKIRTYPIHFGQGCYTHYVDEPKIADICIQSLGKIGYVGAANINLKRHAETGKDFILEINPRFSLWTIIDSVCGVNLPMLQYLDALGLDLPDMKPNGGNRRWLWFGADFKAMIDYRKSGEITLWQWFSSYFSQKGKIEFHIFSWDDPLPLVASWIIHMINGINMLFSFIRKRMLLFKKDC